MIWLLSEGLALIRLSRSRLNSSSAVLLVVVRPDVVVADDVDDEEDEKSAAAGAVIESAWSGDLATEAGSVHQYPAPTPSKPKKISNNNPPNSNPYRRCRSGGAVSESPNADRIVNKGAVLPLPALGRAFTRGVVSVISEAESSCADTAALTTVVSSNKSGAAYHSRGVTFSKCCSATAIVIAGDEKVPNVDSEL